MMAGFGPTAARRGRARGAGDPNAGVSIVEVQREQDVPRLQDELRADPQVEFVSRVPVRYLKVKRAARRAAGGPPPAGTMWNLRRIAWAQARARRGFKDARAISVAVLDSGIDAQHPDLRAKVKGNVFAHPDLPDVSGSRDLIGHGTHVAGTIAAAVNSIGIHGVCDCRLFSWKIFDDVADYDPDTNEFVYYVEPVMYRRALADCLDQEVDVINLSIGGPGEPDPQEQALFDALVARGTSVVAAMGNERDWGSPTSYPAAIPGVIAVGATSADDTVASFSNAGNHIALAAPGVAIWSTLPRYRGQFGFEAVIGPSGRPVEGKALRRERHYAAWNGTSMASPHVAGAVALLLANAGAMSPAAVRERLMETADEVEEMTGDFDADYGAGRLNLLRLLS
jgi:subtilisin family serine protease